VLPSMHYTDLSLVPNHEVCAHFVDRAPAQQDKPRLVSGPFALVTRSPWVRSPWVRSPYIIMCISGYEQLIVHTYKQV